MSTRRNTSDADAADVASTEEAQGRGVSGRSSQLVPSTLYTQVIHL